MKKTLFAILALTLSSLSAFAATEKPDVLLIGDSISIGYEPYVTEYLKDVAKVTRIKGNAQATKNAFENFNIKSSYNKNIKFNPKLPTKIESYVGDTKWAVIHFNYGLHDLCYRHPESKASGKRDKVNGTVGVTLEEYKVNLQKIIDVLKPTGAKLIFATTTFVPEGEAGRFAEDVHKYNAAAIEVMEKNGVTINPLYELSAQIHKDHGLGDVVYTDKDGDKYNETEGNVHYDKAGSKILGKQVSDYIRKALTE